MSILSGPRVHIHNAAKQDLAKIKQMDKRAAASLSIFLEEVQADNRAYVKLATVGESEYHIYKGVSKEWISAQPLPLWRVRIIETQATSYRIIYGVHSTNEVTVLAIVHKEDMNYDDINTNLNQRILKAWAYADG